MIMEVTLLAMTQDWQKVVYTAAKTCTTDIDPHTLFQEDHETFEAYFDEDLHVTHTEEFNKLINHLYKSGHWSIFEHVNVTFAIKGLTRQTTHQLVRHRHFSFSQQSMRAVNMEYAEMDYPLRYEMHNWFEPVSAYRSLIAKGISPEDARRVLPIGTKTNIVLTANLRALIEFYSVRACSMAQKEITILANKMRRVLTIESKLLASMLMIKCERMGYCNELKNKEGKLCKVRPTFELLKLKVKSLEFS